ncbi:MAG: gliding motility-associated C-terminal domain-containing protein [Lewinellaceae bacterium]|nr:gliding motility-associated C-terminal domain-containing protein [Lewinellaceae bacterium]
MKTTWTKLPVILLLAWQGLHNSLLAQPLPADPKSNAELFIDLEESLHPEEYTAPFATCDDLELTSGTFAPAWVARYGRWREMLNPCNIQYTQDFAGFLSWRHQIHTPADGNVPCFGNGNIPYVPPGYDHAIQLGNWDDGREWERLSTTIQVTQDNSMIEVNTAVFLEDPNHNICRQPRFRIRVYDDNQNIIPCGAYEVYAGSNLPGWGTSYCSGFKPVDFLPWTKMSIDLRNYVGKNVTLQFQTMDCSEGQHSGFALFALRCLRSEIVATPVCFQSDAITLTAPDGFSGYQWSNGASGKSITLTNPQPGQTYTVTLVPYSIINGNCQIQLSYTVPVAPMLTVSPNPVICANTAATLTAQVSEANYSFIWNTGQSGSSISVSTPGVYTVTATNGICTLEDQVTVIQSPLPDVQTAVVDAPCFGSTGQVSAGPAVPGANYTYQWSNGYSGPVQDVLAGLYGLTVTNAVGCSLTATVTVNQPNQTALTTSPDTYKCLDKNATLVANGDFVSYHWSDGSQGSPINVAQPGTYTVTATDASNCTVVHAISVSDYPEPLVSLVAAETIVCPDATTILTVTVSPTQASSYSWSGGNLSGGNGAATAGVYTVTVTDVNGCTGTDDVVIQELPRQTVALSGPPFVCNGQSATVELQLQPGGLSGTAWFSTTSGQSVQVPVAQGNGAWMVTPPYTALLRLDSLALQGYDCPFPELPLGITVEVDKIAVTLKPVLQPNGFPLICPGDADARVFASVENGLSPYTYAWSTGSSQSAELGMLAAGVYTVTVTGANGCTTSSEMPVAEPEPLVVVMNATTPPCFGENNGVIALQKLSGQSMFTVEINGAAPASADKPITGLPPGMYNLHVTDGYCPWDTSVFFPTPPQYFISLVDTFVELELPGPYSFKTITNAPIAALTYSPGGIMSDSTAMRPVSEPLRNTWVTVEAYTPKGCLLTDRLFFQVTNSRLVYVPNALLAGSDGENGLFNISAREGAVDHMALHIFDRWGTLVYENAYIQPDELTSGWDGRSRGKYVSDGVYVWTLRINYVDGSVEQREGDLLVLRVR